jgi:hypothetical protein
MRAPLNCDVRGDPLKGPGCRERSRSRLSPAGHPSLTQNIMHPSPGMVGSRVPPAQPQARRSRTRVRLRRRSVAYLLGARSGDRHAGSNHRRDGPSRLVGLILSTGGGVSDHSPSRYPQRKSRLSLLRQPRLAKAFEKRRYARRVRDQPLDGELGIQAARFLQGSLRFVRLAFERVSGG